MGSIYIFFSAIGPSYDCRERLNLFPTPSRSPHDDWGNRFGIKGKRAVRSSKPDKSRLGRMASHNVYILWKKISQPYIPMQFLYAFEFVNEIVFKKLINFNRLHFCEFKGRKHNILWFMKQLSKVRCLQPVYMLFVKNRFCGPF